MTTASSIAFPTMEVPVPEDTMEMASPLPGHADDFDIDLDVMEDQVSIADKDMMGADDDYPDGSLVMDYPQDGTNDADMMDDIAEPAMVDANEQYPETNDNVEMQYSGDETYEAEMLEDEYDEDIDVPMPKPDEQVPATVENGDAQPPEGGVEESVQPSAQPNSVAETDSEKPALEPHVEAAEEHVTEHKEVPHTESEHSLPGAGNVAQGTELDQVQSERAENKPHKTDQEEQTELQDVQLDASNNDHTDLKEPEDVDRQPMEVQPPVDQPEDQETEPTEKEDTVESNEQKERADVDRARMDQRANLHPVKVYYQDNEISLFPPREGDSSETYFLEDGSIAYESFGKLFECCREVLREHIGEKEILIVDIDALNIQLTEDSSYISKVTLHEIVNLYLRLCQNDNIDEPEAFYLTLSTKLTTPAAVSDLLAAANEGKGLSEVYTWDDYDDNGPLLEDIYAEDQADHELHREDHAEPQGGHEEPVAHKASEVLEKREVPTEKHEEPVSGEPGSPAEPEEPQAPEEYEKSEVSGEPQEDEEPKTSEVPKQDTTNHEDSVHHDLQQEISNETELDVREQDVYYEQQEDQHDENLVSNDRGEGVAPTAEVKKDEYEEGEYEDGEYEEGEYEPELQEYNRPDFENLAYDHHSPNDGSYDSEEQKTESTTTIAPLPGMNLEDEQQYADQYDDAPQTEHGDQDEYHEIEGIGQEDFPEEEANPDATEHIETPEEVEDNGIDGDGNAYDEPEPEQNVEKSNDEHPSESHEAGHGDENGQSTPSEQDATDEALQDDPEDVLHGQSELKSEGDVPGLTQNRSQGTPEPADDLLDIEEQMEGTVQNDKDVNGETADGDQGHAASDEVLNGTEHTSSANPTEGNVADVTFDDEYLNLDFDDEPGHPEPTVSDEVAHENVSTKRTRDPEDEFELTEAPTPDAKRSRPS